MSSRAARRKAFTLFEVLIALAVFVLAALGIAQAISGTVDAAMAARARSQSRSVIESRLAFCQAMPPKVGERRNVEVGGWRIEESLRPFSAKNAEGKSVKGLYELKISAREGKLTNTETISILIHKADSGGGTNP
jgi:prepilin-type N-terminal cleavage/methylation domain-containing protein